MTQAELNRDLAKALGATVLEIRSRGFDLEQELNQLDVWDNRQPLVFDWDAQDVGIWPLARCLAAHGFQLGAIRRDRFSMYSFLDAFFYPLKGVACHSVGAAFPLSSHATTPSADYVYLLTHDARWTYRFVSTHRAANYSW